MYVRPVTHRVQQLVPVTAAVCAALFGVVQVGLDTPTAAPTGAPASADIRLASTQFALAPASPAGAEDDEL